MQHAFAFSVVVIGLLMVLVMSTFETEIRCALGNSVACTVIRTNAGFQN